MRPRLAEVHQKKKTIFEIDEKVKVQINSIVNVKERNKLFI